MAAASEVIHARASTETDRRHLLAESICHSESSSLIDLDTTDGERTPRARSPVSVNRQSQSQSQSNSGVSTVDASSQAYKGFPSQAHYLAALNAWAESKRYLDPGESTITGYYGTTTVAELASRPRIQFGFSSWKQQRKEKREAKKRSPT